MKNAKIFITIIISVLAIFLLAGCKKDPEETKPIEPSVNEVKIVFDSDGGSKVDDMIVTKNTSVTLPTPTKDGYEFVGWFDEDSKRISASHVFTKDLNLKASWNKVEPEEVIVEIPSR